MIWIKVCGLTTADDAAAAIEAGVSAIGLVFAPSPRQVSSAQAVEIAAIVRGRVEIVGVFKDASLVQRAHDVVHFDRVQIHGGGSLTCSVPVLRAIKPDVLASNRTSAEGEMTLIDGSEGQGAAFDWMRLSPLPPKCVIAGGLNPENVSAAIACLRPYGVDVSSGVERSPGRKDSLKMNRFVEAARRAHGDR